MSQLQSLFAAQANGIAFSASTSTPTPATLTYKGNTVRICNEGAVAAYCAFGTSATDTGAIATLPGSSPLTTCCFVGPGADITLTLPNSTVWFASAITRSGSAVVVFYIGDGV